MSEETVDRGDDFEPTGTDAAEQTDKVVDEAVEKDIEELAAKKGDAGLKAGGAKEGEEKTGATEDDAETDKDDEKAEEKAVKKDTRIPLARHKEIIDKERERRAAVETELAKYKQGKEIAETNQEISQSEEKLLGLEKDYAKALVDGETDKATTLMQQIRKLERSINEQNAQMREAAAEARAVERVRYDTTVERLEQAYPQLNPDHDEYDKEQVGEVLELKEAYQLKGYTPSQALQKAVKLIMKPVTVKQERATEVEARVDADAVAKQRAADARKKTEAAVEKTPPSLQKVGKDSDKAGGSPKSARDVMKMSQEEFAKLTDEDLATMRGDAFA